MTHLKSSFYNILIPVPEVQEYMLYNTLSGGLQILDHSFGKFFSTLGKDGLLDPGAFPEYKEEIEVLRESGYLVGSDVNERDLYRQLALRSIESSFEGTSSLGLTVGTTIICNMGCPYCFEFHKPNMTLKDDAVIDALIRYMEEIVEKAPVNKWDALHVTWYGGEPLINTKGIEKLSPKLVAFCEKHDIPYGANIITNGLLLDRKAWALLKKHQIGNIQVTIDGAKEIHNKYRPLKTKGGRNYERIMENLSYMPEDMELTIRVNTDKHVAATFTKLMDDLRDYGLWPQRLNDVKVEPAWLRTYEEAEERDLSGRLSNPEFFDELQKFRQMQLDRYNTWAAKNYRSSGKLKWKMPAIQSDCATWVSPYHLVIDPDGNIHKCWETIHDSKQSASHVFQEWNPDDFKYYADYDRTDVHEICYDCKYLPVCDGMSCSHEVLNYDHLPCTHWKTRTEPYFKEQYLKWKRDPDSVILPESEATGMQTHANR